MYSCGYVPCVGMTVYLPEAYGHNNIMPNNLKPKHENPADEILSKIDLL